MTEVKFRAEQICKVVQSLETGLNEVSGFFLRNCASELAPVSGTLPSNSHLHPVCSW